MKNINITIEGQTGSGKTTVAMLIQKALREHNIIANVVDSEYSEAGFKALNERMDDTLAAMEGKVTVTIMQKQLSREV